MAEPKELAELQAALLRESAGWQAAITSMSALSDADKRARLGYVPGPDEPSLAEREQMALASFQAYRVEREMAFGYPVAMDWRSHGGRNFITPVRDQGGCGSCVAFGTSAAVEGALRAGINDPNFPVDYSEAHLFYCHARAQGRNCGNGWWVAPALDAFKNIGVVDEACYPYTAMDQNCTNLCNNWQSRVTKISAWHAITSVADMKTWLSSRGPLVACFTVYDDFFSYRSGIYRHVSGGVAGGHCVCCIGYNETNGCWICKNSWGAGWGESGYFRIAYGQVGIDATMWAVDGFATGVWQSNKRIIGLWAINQDRNAWAFVEGIGWKRIAFDNDNIFFNLLLLLTTAKAANRAVNYYEQDGIIKQAYIF